MLFAALSIIIFGTASAWGPSGQKVLLSQVDTLTMYSDRTTEYRRTVLILPYRANLIETISAIRMRWRGCYEI